MPTNPGFFLPIFEVNPHSEIAVFRCVSLCFAVDFSHAVAQKMKSEIPGLAGIRANGR